MTGPALDPYTVLGIRREATRDEIVHAYRALLREHHPDTRGLDPPADSDTSLDEVVAAYRVLRDPVRRADYDRRTQPKPPPRSPRAVGQQPPIVAGPVIWQPPPRPR